MFDIIVKLLSNIKYIPNLKHLISLGTSGH